MKLPELKLRGLPDIAHLDQYCGPWSIEAQRCAQLLATVSAAHSHGARCIAAQASAWANTASQIESRIQ